MGGGAYCPWQSTQALRRGHASGPAFVGSEGSQGNSHRAQEPGQLGASHPPWGGSLNTCKGRDHATDHWKGRHSGPCRRERITTDLSYCWPSHYANAFYASREHLGPTSTRLDPIRSEVPSINRHLRGQEDTNPGLESLLCPCQHKEPPNTKESTRGFPGEKPKKNKQFGRQSCEIVLRLKLQWGIKPV